MSPQSASRGPVERVYVERIHCPDTEQLAASAQAIPAGASTELVEPNPEKAEGLTEDPDAGTAELAQPKAETTAALPKSEEVIPMKVEESVDVPSATETPGGAPAAEGVPNAPPPPGDAKGIESLPPKDQEMITEEDLPRPRRRKVKFGDVHLHLLKARSHPASPSRFPGQVGVRGASQPVGRGKAQEQDGRSQSRRASPKGHASITLKQKPTTGQASMIRCYDLSSRTPSVQGLGFRLFLITD